jgi:amino acid transporter
VSKEHRALGAKLDQVELRRFGYQQELRRGLTLRELLVYGLVCVSPIAPFAVFGVVFNASKGMVPLTYLIGFVAMIFTALSYREMSRAFPIAGSVYSYAGRGLHPVAGFLTGWAILLDYLLLPALLYVAGAAALGSVLPAVPQWVWVIMFVVVNTVVNLHGIETTARTSKIFLVCQLMILALFVVLAVVAISHGVNGASWSVTPFYNPAAFEPSLIFGALSVAAISFLGFDAISTMAEETTGAARVVGRATLMTLAGLAGLFIAQTYLAALLVPRQTQFVGQTATNEAFFTVAELVGGDWFKVATVLVGVLAATACALIAQAATSRLLFSMARDRQLPRFLAYVHPTRKVPQRSVLVTSLVNLLLGLFFVGQIGLLSSLVDFGALFSFLLLHMSVTAWYLIRKRERGYGLHLVVPLLGFVIIGYVLVNIDIDAKIGGLAWLAVGAVVLIVLRLTGRFDRAESSPRAADRSFR